MGWVVFYKNNDRESAQACMFSKVHEECTRGGHLSKRSGKSPVFQHMHFMDMMEGPRAEAAVEATCCIIGEHQKKAMVDRPIFSTSVTALNRLWDLFICSKEGNCSYIAHNGEAAAPDLDSEERV